MNKLFNMYDFKLNYNINEKPHYYEVERYTGSDKMLIIPKYFLHDQIEIIESCSFRGNKYLKVLILSDAIRIIKSDAFMDTCNLVVYTPLSKGEIDFGNNNNVTVKYGLEEIYEQDDLFYALLNDGTATVVGNNLDDRKYNSFSDFGLTVEVPDFVSDHRVVHVGNYAFSHTYNVKNYIFNKNLESIGAFAFENNTMLEGFFVSDNVSEIGDFALKDCFRLKLVEISKSVQNLGYHLLEGVYKPIILFEHDEINIETDFNPENLTIITGHQSSISKGNLHYGLLRNRTAIIIGHSIYHKTDIIVPETIEVEGVEYKVERIAPFCFSGLKYIVKVSLPETITHIYQSAFSESSLYSINLPKNLLHLSEAVFYECINLIELSIPAGIKEIPRGLCNRCFSLEKVVLPEGLKKISRESFLEANQLRSINFPISIEEIGEASFYNTKVGYIELGYNIKNIDDLAFAYCNELRTLIIQNEFVKLGDRIIDGNENMQIFIEGNDESNSSIILMKQSKKKNKVFNEIYKVSEIEGVKYLITHSESIFVVGCNPDSLEKDVKIVHRIGHSEVTKIISCAFKNAVHMETLFIPETVLKIEDYFAIGTLNLKKLTIPNHLNPLRAAQLVNMIDLAIEVYDDSDNRDLNELFDEINHYLDSKDYVNPIEIREKFNLSHTQLYEIMKRVGDK